MTTASSGPTQALVGGGALADPLSSEGRYSISRSSAAFCSSERIRRAWTSTIGGACRRARLSAWVWV